MEIELTSSRDDGTWTWRAAGAREPRGIIAGKVLSPGAHVGDVLRVEAEFELEGISILAVLQPRERPKDPSRIELAAQPVPAGSVTTSLVSKTEGRTRDRAPRDRSGALPASRARRGERPTTKRSSPATQRARTQTRRAPRETPSSPEAPRPVRKAPPTREPRRTRPPRFLPGTAHRDTLLATLLPEQRPIAEQLAIGGLPAVRRALAEQRSKTQATGQPHVTGDAIVELAEQLLPAVREATWLDRAEAAKASLETISLRDLRATVTSGAPRDDAGRELLATLRAAFHARLAKLRTTWESDIARAVEEGRVLHALHLSARPPEPSTRFPAALVQSLAASAGAALNAELSPERWIELLDAAATSPIRRSIKPTAIPADPSGELHKAATVLAGRIPSLARLLGLRMPPPPRPVAHLLRHAKTADLDAAKTQSVAKGDKAPSEHGHAIEGMLAETNGFHDLSEALDSKDTVIDEPLLEAVDEV